MQIRTSSSTWGETLVNDLDPEAKAGLVAVQLRRGPRGLLQPASGHVRLVLESLAELPGTLASLS